jgi:hypothetical protein
LRIFISGAVQVLTFFRGLCFSIVALFVDNVWLLLWRVPAVLGGSAAGRPAGAYLHRCGLI